DELRQSWIDFFASRGHTVVPSASVIPVDRTLLFTVAGMVPFKPYFVGDEAPPFKRATSSQKCVRAGGKHNDLDDVGRTKRHLVFFEMLGNFSFGDYFKREIIPWSWEMTTETFGLDGDRLWITVHDSDDEAEAIWHEQVGVPMDRIQRLGDKDNFWQMGDTGPCGPCSEIHYYKGEHPNDAEFNRPEYVNADGSPTVEIWNLVFMQYDRDEAGVLHPLPHPSIDTGAGLERVSAVLQGVDSNYETDLFRPILDAAADLAKLKYGEDPEKDVSLRVIADHLRAVTFLLADGVIPGNEGRGYVLRRILRRAVRHGMRLGFEEPFFHKLVPVLGEIMGQQYLELAATRQASVSTIRTEEEKFLSTVANGARQVQEEIERLRPEGRTELPGAMVFRLYDTYGLPLEVIREIAEEERFRIDEAGFSEAMQSQREQSRKATAEVQNRMAALREVVRGHAELAETRFEGYDRTEMLEAKGAAEVVRLATWKDGAPERVSSISQGQSGVVILDQTVFYAESGGQVGDTGYLLWDGGRARVVDTQKDASFVYFHFVEVEQGALTRHMRVQLKVDHEVRLSTQRNHTATHLLHSALRQVLGKSVRQAGSLVAPDRLRFDFTYHRGMFRQEMEQTEDLVNEWVRRAVATEFVWRSYQEAIAAGAMALFGEKYGERVRTVNVPGFSLELCGGCHVRNTGEIGLFMIDTERGVASGVRRIEAVTGTYALAEVRQQRTAYQELVTRLGIRSGDYDQQLQRAEQIRQRQDELEQEMRKLRMQLVSGATVVAEEERMVEGIRVLAREVPPAPASEMREMADTLRSKLGSGVVVIGSRSEDNVSLVAAVTKDLTPRIKAGELVKRLSPIVGGGGGGRPDFAQAGGKLPENLPEALAAVEDAIREQLSR
ncbi:MAG: alanyl-tRNA synthetase, partial [Acidobacteriota bacterium]|nr:alanyl-tRNA synthetase [Acidobacteriota bacterium]